MLGYVVLQFSITRITHTKCETMDFDIVGLLCPYNSHSQYMFLFRCCGITKSNSHQKSHYLKGFDKYIDCLLRMVDFR